MNRGMIDAAIALAYRLFEFLKTELVEIADAALFAPRCNSSKTLEALAKANSFPYPTDLGATVMRQRVTY